MKTPPLVPPIKCQGIKTKLVGDIYALADHRSYARWVEPFCGSCVVPLNLQPPQALLTDSNLHIIQFYQDIQNRKLDASLVRDFLKESGHLLETRGEDFFYEVRQRFNETPNSLDFLFLNRSCFNGVMRFNRKGCFNVPFCRKPERFSQSYITKICNQVTSIATVILRSDWEFMTSGFRETLARVQADDFVYADPPYAGRHADYFNSWSEDDETSLCDLLEKLPCAFVLSTWHGNEFRSNPTIEARWSSPHFSIVKKEHFYHVGSSEDLRHAMTEALITNFPAKSQDRTTTSFVAQTDLPFGDAPSFLDALSSI